MSDSIHSLNVPDATPADPQVYIIGGIPRGTAANDAALVKLLEEFYPVAIGYLQRSTSQYYAIFDDQEWVQYAFTTLSQSTSPWFSGENFSFAYYGSLRDRLVEEDAYGPLETLPATVRYRFPRNSRQDGSELDFGKEKEKEKEKELDGKLEEASRKNLRLKAEQLERIQKENERLEQLLVDDNLDRRDRDVQMVLPRSTTSIDPTSPLVDSHSEDNHNSKHGINHRGSTRTTGNPSYESSSSRQNRDRSRSPVAHRRHGRTRSRSVSPSNARRQGPSLPHSTHRTSSARRSPSGRSRSPEISSHRSTRRHYSPETSSRRSSRRDHSPEPSRSARYRSRSPYRSSYYRRRSSSPVRHISRRRSRSPPRDATSSRRSPSPAHRSSRHRSSRRESPPADRSHHSSRRSPPPQSQSASHRRSSPGERRSLNLSPPAARRIASYRRHSPGGSRSVNQRASSPRGRQEIQRVLLSSSLPDQFEQNCQVIKLQLDAMGFDTSPFKGAVTVHQGFITDHELNKSYDCDMSIKTDRWKHVPENGRMTENEIRVIAGIFFCSLARKYKYELRAITSTLPQGDIRGHVLFHWNSAEDRWGFRDRVCRGDTYGLFSEVQTLIKTRTSNIDIRKIDPPSLYLSS